MKKIFKSILMPILMIACIFMISACQPPKEDGITLKTEFKTVYYVGEMLDVTGGILSYTKDGKTVDVILKQNMIDGFSSSTAGTRNMVILYEGYTTTVSYTIREIPEFTVNYNTVYSTVAPDGSSYAYLKFFVNNYIGMAASLTNLSKDQVTFDNINKNTYTKAFINGDWVLTWLDPSDSRATYKLENITANSVKLTVIHATQGVLDSATFYAMA